MTTPVRAHGVRDVLLSLDGAGLPGLLTVPADAAGVVAFAHGSGSSRLSPRNRFVSALLNDSGIATLMFDLLTSREAADRVNVFDVDLLAARLVGATGWLESRPEIDGLPVGYFGASTGTAAALTAAADLGQAIRAVVSRGGRPDLAGVRLASVRAPTLLVVGGADEVVLELNRRALASMICEAELRVVPGATHLFEEPGALEEVARLARDWFVRHLVQTT
jgi:pimeloyl-ACP methyl ester carboxylesterase